MTRLLCPVPMLSGNKVGADPDLADFDEVFRDLSAVIACFRISGIQCLSEAYRLNRN